MSSVNKTSTSKKAENTSNHSIQTEPTSTTDNDQMPIQVATKFEEESTKTIDLNDIQAPADLAELRKKDPFMYHSIPAVRANVMQGTEVDVSTLAASAETPVVRRRRRISYEGIDGTVLVPSGEMMMQMMNEAQRQRQSESSNAEANYEATQ